MRALLFCLSIAIVFTADAKEPLSKVKKSLLKTFPRTQVQSKAKIYPRRKINRKGFQATYNKGVKKWIAFFQGRGKRWFTNRLARSHRYLPMMRRELRKRGLPQELAYMSMIESGFSPHAISTAEAVGYWQFIKPTALRYGLKINWWVDERRDFKKSTQAATKYLGDLYRLFGSWHLTAAAYNMGETRLKRLIKRHKSNNFWVLSKKRDFPDETRNYIPKLIAALLIASHPKRYGFENRSKWLPHSYDYFYTHGGVDLHNLAKHLGVGHKRLKKLNPELLHGFVPSFVNNHLIRVPKGSLLKVSEFMRLKKR